MKTMEWALTIPRKELKGFIGYTRYFSQFTENNAGKKIPMYACARWKNTDKFTLTEAAEESFKIIKSEILNAAYLTPTGFDEKIYDQADASNLSTGACLSQIHDNTLWPVLFL